MVKAKEIKTIDRKRISKYVDDELIYSEFVNTNMIEDLVCWFHSQNYKTWRDITKSGMIRYYEKDNIKYEVLL